MAAFEGGSVNDFDNRVVSKSGERRWINMSVIPVTNGKGENPILIHLFRDIHEKKQGEALLHQILEMAGQTQAGASGHVSDARFTDGEQETLTPRERQTLSLLSKGYGTKEIARSLSISPHTTRNHIQSILQKLGVHSRLEAVLQAIEYGLIQR
jgi:DNA-binding NarL/FixJ family response regulator